MGYNMHDLKNGAEQFHDKIRQREQAKGEELANNLIYSTSQGRGLWSPLLWTGWLFILGLVTSVAHIIFHQDVSITSPATWVGIVGGFIAADSWYSWSYTRKHPFWSTMLACFGLPLFIMIFIDKLPLN